MSAKQLHQLAQQEREERKQEILKQTAKIRWHELQNFFASGQLINVDQGLDLVELATSIASDELEKIEILMSEEKVAPVSDELASFRYEQNTQVWAVVVAPWIFVQQA